MLNGLPQTAGKIISGVAGVTVLAANANTVAILAEVVRRAVSQLYAMRPGATPAPKGNDEWKLKDFTPYSSTKGWQSLGIAALKNVVVGTAALYVAHRFCPSLVTNANSLLNVVGIQFTPHNPLLKLARL